MGLVKTPTLRSTKTAPTAADALPIQALTRDGLLIRDDGVLVRYLNVVPNNPLVLDEQGCDRMTRGLTDLLLRLPAGMNAQFYVQGDPVSREDLIAEMRAETDGATAELIASADPAEREQGYALRALAAMREEGFTTHAEAQAALHVRYVLVVTYDPSQQTRPLGWLPVARRHREKTPLVRDLDTHIALMRDSQELADQLRSTLRGLEFTVESMSGPQIAQLLWSRMAPAKARSMPEQAPGLTDPTIFGSLDHAVDRHQAVAAAGRLRSALAQGTLDFRPASHVVVDGDLEQTGYVSRRPQKTFYGWLLHAMQSDRPWTLSLHVTVRDRAAERQRFARRERVLWGLNTGESGPPNRNQQRQESEVVAIGEELADGAESIADVAIYISIREPGPSPDPAALNEAAVRALRALAQPVEAGVQQGPGQQPDLWLSTLPLGLDVANETFAVMTRNAADSIPFVATSSGSPNGIPFAFSDPGRTVERINPYDALHSNAVTLCYAKSGAGKTATVIDILIAVLSRGGQGSVIDRSQDGHYKTLCSLIPGAAHLALGAEHDTSNINAWDVDDVNAVPKDKIGFLLSLHALLIGEHNPAEDRHGLNRLQRALLAHAIRTTYRRAARDDRVPRESLLHEILVELAALEADRAPDHAATYRDLALGVAEFCGEGTYGHLFDRPTSLQISADSPLVVFNTAKLPEEIAPALLFSIFEYITNRTEARWARQIQRRAAGYRPAGPFDGTSVLVFEEVWKVIERRETASFVAERARRGRHSGLWTIALSQTRSDMNNPNARALLDNATLHLILAQSRAELQLVARGVGLSTEEVDQISQLTTEKGVMAQAYFVNGARGRGSIAIRLSAPVYWIATSEVHHDVPRRALALRGAGGDPWGALELLTDQAWHDEIDRAAA
jgi:hypothetical protein